MSTEHLKPFRRTDEQTNALRRFKNKQRNTKKWKAEEDKMAKLTEEWLKHNKPKKLLKDE